MQALGKRANERPRELRRRVMVSARLRSGAQWSDACILNISSRGLMIHSARAGPEGSLVELRRGDHVMIARVVWRRGGRAGLRSDEPLPIEQILSLGDAASLGLVASDGLIVERRKQRREGKGADARSRGRMVEFVGVALLALCLAMGMLSLLRQAFVRPIAELEASFDRRS